MNTNKTALSAPQNPKTEAARGRSPQSIQALMQLVRYRVDDAHMLEMVPPDEPIECGHLIDALEAIDVVRRNSSSGQQAQHTPGPWFVVDDSCIDNALEIKTHPDATRLSLYVATVWGGDRSVANANLVAAAPDLLAACKALLTAYTTTDLDLLRARFDVARSAIAKAEGR